MRVVNDMINGFIYAASVSGVSYTLASPVPNKLHVVGFMEHPIETAHILLCDHVIVQKYPILIPITMTSVGGPYFPVPEGTRVVGTSDPTIANHCTPFPKTLTRPTSFGDSPRYNCMWGRFNNRECVSGMYDNEWYDFNKNNYIETQETEGLIFLPN